MEKKEALVEAVLFLAGRYLSIQELVMFTNVNPILLKEILSNLEKKYENHEAFIIVEKEGNYKMDVRSKFAYLVNKLASGQTEFSKAEQETLAIIAYKQPITQAVVVKIRGNKAYDHIKHLREVGLIKGKKMGHTSELYLEDQFYDYFNVVKKEKQEIVEKEQEEQKEEQKEKEEK